MIYLDTSALIKLYLIEEHSEEVEALIVAQDDPLPVCELQEMELTNAFRLKVFWKELGEVVVDQQLAHFHERKRKGLYFTPEIDRSHLLTSFHELSLQTQKLGCRTLDILHVAYAQQVSPTCFVTFDLRQRTLAQAAGLPVWGEAQPKVKGKRSRSEKIRGKWPAGRGA